MDALNLLKFWRNPIEVNDVISGIDYISNRMPQAEFNSGDDNDENEDEDDDDDDDSFFELELNTMKNGIEQDAKLVESPRDVFRNARVFPFDSPLSSKPQSPKSMLKSAPPKFKVFMLGFKKSKTQDNYNTTKQSLKSVEIGQSKRFAFIEGGLVPHCGLLVEETPVFSRDNSLRSKLLRESIVDSSVNDKKEPKYMKVIKPLYSMASKRYNAESSPVSSPRFSPACSPRKVSVEKQPNTRISGFRNVCKSLGKSKSAVSAASPVNRRDDSLLQDGIQGAILHCKRSYNSPAKELTRCASNPAREKSGIGGRDSELMKRSSI